MLHSTGAAELRSPLDYINEAGEFLVTVHPWKWLERQELRVNEYKGVPYVRLPLRFPHEVRDIIAIQPSGAVIDGLGWSSFGTLLERRAYGGGAPFTRRLALTHLPALPVNLLLSTSSMAEATVGGSPWARTGTDPITVA